MLSASDRDILKKIIESTTKTVTVTGTEAAVEDFKFPVLAAQRLLSMTALREVDSGKGYAVYELTSTGRHMLTNPEVEAQLVVALGLIGI